MTEKTESFIQVIPSGGALGAEIRGVDLSRPVPVETVQAIREAWLEHIVLYFRDQQLSDAQLIGFGQCFGELHRVEYQDRERPPGVPKEIEIVSNVVVDGVAVGLLGNSEVAWHTDMSMWEEQASATVLYGEAVPDQGGGTRFCNGYRAYAELDESIRARVEGRRSIHDSAYMADGAVRAGFENVSDKSKGPGARHPVVCTHPETGRKTLYLGRKGYGYILGLDEPESDELLDRIWQHLTRPEFVWEHQWRKGDVLMWDNRCTAHSRGALASGQRRQLRRVTVKGTAPR